MIVVFSFFIFSFFNSFCELLFAKEIQSPKELLILIEEYYKKNPDFKGNFEILENQKLQDSGQFFFKSPYFLKLIFFRKRNIKKLLISNKNILWMYLPKEKLIIDQDLNLFSHSRIEEPYGQLKKILIPGYFRFEKIKIKKEKVPEFNQKLFILDIQTKTEYFGFSRLSLYIQEDGLILCNKILYSDKKEKSFRKKNIKVEKISLDEFEPLNIPDVKIIKNPFYY